MPVTESMEFKYPDSFSALSKEAQEHVYSIELAFDKINTREAQVNNRENRLTEQERLFLADAQAAINELYAAWDDIKTIFEKMRGLLDAERDDMHDRLKQHSDKLAAYRKVRS
jgi:hypothetical protein